MTSHKCWVVTEGLAGTENQCIGVAEALGVDFDVKRVALHEPWRSLSPYIGLEQSWSFVPRLEGPWPDLVIAAGRKAISATRFIAKRSPETFICFIQDPRTAKHSFDLIAVPEHDPLRGDNVIVTRASPNRITAERLADAKAHFPELGTLSNPRVAVLIGGRSKAYDMSEDTTCRIADDLSHIEGSLMVTCSRRTGTENERILRDTLGHHFFWDGQGDNPYMAMLAWADTILVTADSASMISDACTTGKPVYMIDLDGGSKRITALHDNLIKAGILRRFTGSLEPYTYEPLNDAQMIANEIRTCIQKS